ncbi:hypothetical protein [Mycobacterium talmoniae]|uniref:Uncharacterized protein n=1 Tax=Mycobacterium talmoniae TaxID=1858794 RepID=A0A1S1NL79_9MYCO|nr:MULTISPECIES: hypothetical protein [Mycobacterium]OHV03947.1 hypothetical protein BKN37_12365 [Mycobacterium talmoniae]PQM46707.1 hypothetical protein C1Y40_03148 [Mycobacterium talmoniae]TDH52086.1 hypothetical protein E2F47_14995 [Mycobacterium eburneum]
MTSIEEATSWRDLADQLTPDQVAGLQQWDSNPRSMRHDAALLGCARDFAKRNLLHTVHHDVPPPPDASSVSDWENPSDGDEACRFFIGTVRGTTVRVESFGFQSPGGDVKHRGIFIADRTADDHVTIEIDADVARRLAADLLAAAAELDQLG